MCEKISKIVMIVTIVVLCLLFATPFVTFFTILFSTDWNSTQPMVYIEDVESYNSEEYPLSEVLFLKELPQKAEIVDFSYYLYYRAEEEDTYLELRFDSSEDMQEYLDELTETLIRSYQERYNENLSIDGEWFVEEKNPYNDSYVDMFSVVFDISFNNKDFVGYAIEPDEDYFVYKCRFGIISYSKTDFVCTD